MEDFESPTLETGNGPSSGVEKPSEQSEKQRESYKKAQAQIQRSQKDEKKAKGDNYSLFAILERFIQNPYYEDLIPLVTRLLHHAIPSRYILMLISLFYPEAAAYLLTTIGKHQDIDILLSIHREKEMVDFSESSIHPSIRTWMSTWVHAGQVFIIQDTMSIVLQKKLLDFLQQDIILHDALSEVIYFFFISRNIRVSKNITKSYAAHIIREYVGAIKNSLSGAEQELLQDINFNDQALFGLSTDVGEPR